MVVQYFLYTTLVKERIRLPNKDNMLGSAAIHGKARSVLMMTRPYKDPYIKSLRIVKKQLCQRRNKTKGLLLKFNPTTLLHEVVEDKSIKR